MMRVIFAVAITLLSFGLHANSETIERSIENRDLWLEQATSLIQQGDFDTLERSCKATLGEAMHRDVEELLNPLRAALNDRGAIYIDKIDRVEMGRTFDQHVYAAYYGQREFIFYSFIFAKLENGWQLYSIDYADSLEGLSPSVNSQG